MFGDEESTILLANKRVKGNLRTGAMSLEHCAQSPAAHPRFGKQAVSHGDGGL